MTPHYTDPLVTLYLGDCLDVMRDLPDASVDSVVTDPPYGLEFMGKEWDRLNEGHRSGNRAMKPSGEHMNTQAWGSWQKRPASYAPSRVPRCRKCGKYKVGNEEPGKGGVRCKCEVPDFDTRQSEQGFRMQAWHEQWATEAFRVLKPGGYLLAFGGTRTYHRLASAIEDAGFEIRDTLMWIYASGFPKSLDVSKALDKAGEGGFAAREELRQLIIASGLSDAVIAEKAGVSSALVRFWRLGERTIQSREFERIRDLIGGNVPPSADRDKVGEKALTKMNPYSFEDGRAGKVDITAPATDLARKWEGWGTALKPAHEPIVMARKPLVGTVAQNVTRYGTGALNIDGTRIGTTDNLNGGAYSPESEAGHIRRWEGGEFKRKPGQYEQPAGRWPPNVLLSSPELFDEPNPGVVGSGATSVSGLTSTERDTSKHGYEGGWQKRDGRLIGFGDSGGYSRFFIIPKADRAERERGLAGHDKSFTPTMNDGIDGREHSPDDPRAYRANSHPTVKPIDLMRHLVRLVTPPGGVCLDPFAGSGTTGLAASELGVKCILIEREREYCDIALGRLMATPLGLGLFEGDGHEAA